MSVPPSITPQPKGNQPKGVPPKGVQPGPPPRIRTAPQAGGSRPAPRPMPASMPPAQPPRQHNPKPAPVAAERRFVRLALERVDPWSVMKTAFLLSVAVGIMTIVAAVVVWFSLDALHVFAKIKDQVQQLGGEKSLQAGVEYLKLSRAVSLATVVAVVNIILSTALATIGAMIYNVTTHLIGGIYLTLADD